MRSSLGFVLACAIICCGAMLSTVAQSAELGLETVLALTPEDRDALGFETVIAECSRHLEHPLALTVEQRANLHLQRGMARTFTNPSNLAVADFDAVIDLQPGDLTARVFRAVYSRALGHGTEAAETLRTICATAAEPAIAAFAAQNLAAGHIKQKEYDAAIAEASKAIGLDPSCFLAYRHRAFAKLMAGDREGCIQDINHALALNPLGQIAETARNAYSIRGQARSELGDFAGAERDLFLAVRQSPTVPEHLLARYNACTRAGKKELAFVVACLVVEEFPNDDASNKVFGEATAAVGGGRDVTTSMINDLLGSVEIDVDDYEQFFWIHTTPTIDHVTRVMAQDADLTTERRVDLLRKRAAAFTRQGKLELAENDLRRALELDPNNVAVHYRLARLLARDSSRHPDCERVISALLECDTTHAQAHCIRAAIQIAAGRYSDAMPSVERALELQPSLPEAQAQRGRLKLESGDLAGALVDFEAALEQDPTVLNGKGNLFRAHVLAKLGRYPESIRAFVLSRTVSPTFVLPQQMLCRVYLEMGKNEIAAALADQLEAKFPGNPEAIEALAEIRPKLR